MDYWGKRHGQQHHRYSNAMLVIIALLSAAIIMVPILSHHPLSNHA